MRLPNADRAEVDLRKLAEYCLSTKHPIGKHKAIVFRATLGLTTEDSQALREWLLSAASEGHAIFERADEFGDRYRLDFELTNLASRAMIRTSRIVRAGEDFPRLTTCFVLPK